ncbi:MAG: EVE domain-containing protein [Deferribacterales bacterium]
MRYWLMKSEPESFSIDRLAGLPEQTTSWDGVRNYQARNFMRDDMKDGDLVLFYHSNCDEPGIVGLAKVKGVPYPDFTAFDASSKYYDPKSNPDKPTWIMVDVQLVRKFNKTITLKKIKADDRLTKMMLTQKGSRLSVQPVTEEEFGIIMSMEE